MGITEVEPGTFDFSVCALDRGARQRLFTAPFHNLHFRACVFLEQILCPKEFSLCSFQVSLGAGQLGLCGLQIGLIFFGIDHEQQITFVDVDARLKVHALQHTRDAGAHLNLCGGHCRAGELQRFGHFLDQRLGDRHFGGRWRDIGVRLLAACKRQCQREEAESQIESFWAK